MNVEAFVTDLLELNPGLEPLQPYVTGMKHGGSIAETEDPCLNAAAQIFVNDLESSHTIVQAMEGNEVAAYLHGIIHRREGDFWNANYWFRQAPQFSHALSTKPQELTTLVESTKVISSEIHDQLFNEWKAIVRYIISSRQ